MATTTIGAPGVVFPDGSTQTTAFVASQAGTKLTVLQGPGAQSIPWTKPVGLKGVHVRIYAAGGDGGPGVYVPNSEQSGGGGGGGGVSVGWFPGPSIPGPLTITIGAPGNASSFGSLISATGGGSVSANNRTGGAGGSGSGGQFNFTATPGTPSNPYYPAANCAGGYGTFMTYSQYWNPAGNSPGNQGVFPGAPNPNYSGGGSGGRNLNLGGTATGGTGGPALMIIEEFY